LSDSRKGNESAQVLVIGANGLIGQRISRVLDERGISWAGTCHRRPAAGLVACDIANPDDVRRLAGSLRPQVVFHCANLAGGVDFCESHPDAASAFHGDATRRLGSWCAQIGATLVFFSSDYVFDGTQPEYREEDAPNPLNIYGRLKLDAERWIQAHLGAFVILRTTNVFGWDPQTATPNYIMAMYGALKRGQPFRAPSFLWGTPTYVGDLAEAAVELIDRGARGVFHVVGSSFVSRFQWALEACRILELDASLVEELAQPSPQMVPRPLRSRLCTDAFTRRYETPLHDATSGLELMKEDALQRSRT
jgi:dTDP-4-dehydrorhamnose reductase